MDTAEILKVKVKEFYCPECKKRVDLCKCEKYEDGGCWDCGSDCVVNNRREAIKDLKEAIARGMTLPVEFLGLDHLFADTEVESFCCGFPLKKFFVKIIVSPRLFDENVLYICSFCGIAYNQP